jgi:hypothetical protein
MNSSNSCRSLRRLASDRNAWKAAARFFSQVSGYLAAAQRLAGYLKEGFVRTIDDEDSDKLSPRELLAWSSVHGLASLFVDGPVAREQAPREKLRLADAVLKELRPAFCR